MKQIINKKIIDKYIKLYNKNPYIPFNESFYRELWEDFTSNQCILNWCISSPIWSHLYPKWYLLKNGKRFIKSETQHFEAKHLKTPLFCKTHDNNLFELSDNINDFTDLISEKIQKNDKLENYFLKLLFFKYKTLIIELNSLQFYIQQWILENQNLYNLLLIQFEKINKEIENYNTTWNINIETVYAWYIWKSDSKKYTLFSNICFIEEKNIPFWLILNQDKWWITLWICVYWEDYPIDLVREIKDNIHNAKFRLDSYELINYIQKTFKLEKSYNRTIIMNKNIIDIWLTNFYTWEIFNER